MFAPKAEAKGIKIIVRANVLPENVFGDERRFKQVLINLVKNSLKFIAHGDVVAIDASYSVDQQMLIVSVTDTGVGISPEDLPKLFTRFGKLHRSSEMNHDGIGLGLTIVK